MKKTLVSSLLLIACCFVTRPVNAQVTLPLNDLSAFKSPAANWSVVGSVANSPDEDAFRSTAGTGILLNTKTSTLYQAGTNLLSAFEHGDVKLELDFVMPKSSNSGIYLMGRYEVQLFDSWGVKAPKASDCGGIYERWNEARSPKGYEGHPPRQNVCKAPGLWQHLDIEFQAPQFDASGKKIKNARFVKIVLNGVTIHENVELSGPTRSAAFADEKSSGPIMIQGDHGSVAFRNIRYESFDKQPVTLSPLTYAYYEGKFSSIQDNQTATPASKGTVAKLNYRLADKNMDFLITFSGKLTCPEAGLFTFAMPVTGKGKLVIDGQPIIEHDRVYWRNEVVSKSVNLSAGEHNIVVSYTKDFGWGGRALGVFVSRTGMKPVSLHEYKSLPNPDPVGEIAVEAEGETVLQRSFVMHLGKKRTHALNVGDPTGVHYTYDLNQGNLLQVWKGEFLNATEMWYERGEPQTSEPLGAPVYFPVMCPLVPENSSADTLNDEKDFLYKGYVLNQDKPTFTYQIGSNTYEDQLIPDGKILNRTLTFKQLTSPLTCRLATGKVINSLGKGLYSIDGQYFVQVPESQSMSVATLNGRQVLVTKVGVGNQQVKYAIVW